MRGAARPCVTIALKPGDEDAPADLRAATDGGGASASAGGDVAIAIDVESSVVAASLQ